MTKVVPATCENEEVTADDVVVPEADILSQGKKASAGLLVIDRDKKTYLTSNAEDIADLIESLVEIINQIATIATGLDGATNSPGAQASAIAQLQTLKTELDQTKEQLK